MTQKLSVMAAMYRLRSSLAALFVTSILGSTVSAQEKIEIKLRGVVGDRHQTTLQTEEKKTDVFNSRKNSSLVNFRMTSQTEIIAVPNDGTLRIRTTYTHIALTLNGDGKIMLRFDSARDYKSKEALHVLLNSFIGQDFVITVDSQGKILNVQGADVIEMRAEKAMKSAKSNFGNLEIGSGPGFIEQSLSSWLGFAHFPDSAVAPGDSWKKNFARQAEYALLVDQTSTLKANHANFAVIEYRNVIKPDRKNIIAYEDRYTDSREVISGQGTGSYWLNKSDGQITSSFYERRLLGKLEFEDKAIEGEDLSGSPPIDMNSSHIYVKTTTITWSKKLAQSVKAQKSIDVPKIER